MQKQKNNKNKLKSLTQTTIKNYSVTIREQSFYPTTQMQAADSNCMIIALKKNVRKNNKAPS